MHQIKVIVVKTELKKVILAVIAQDSQLVFGGAPVFIATSQEEQEKIALYLSRILNGMIHDVVFMHASSATNVLESSSSRLKR